MDAVKRYFGWVLVWSVPFWVLGLWAEVSLPFGLPVSAAMVVVPAAVATALSPAPGALWRGLADVHRVPLLWLGVTVLAMPFALTVSRLWAGLGVSPLPWADVPLMVALYLPGAVLEEIGWTGFATPRAQARLGVLGAGIVIGVVWALWHVVPWAWAQGHDWSWVLGQCVATVALRLHLGVLYRRGGQSLALVVVAHTMINLAGSLAPAPATFDPWRLAVVVLGVTALLAIWPARSDDLPDAGKGDPGI